MTSAETSIGVPHTCHDEGTTKVMSSHSKALQTASELETSRSALTVKCLLNSRSTFEATLGVGKVYTSNMGKRHFWWATATEIRDG